MDLGEREGGERTGRSERRIFLKKKRAPVEVPN